jgi:P4 family phage/plasmid primase-like protien
MNNTHLTFFPSNRSSARPASSTMVAAAATPESRPPNASPGRVSMPESGTWDPAHARRHLEILFEPGQVFEIRALDVAPHDASDRPRFTAAGVFDSAAKAVEVLADFLRGHACKGVYVTLNPLNPATIPPTNTMVFPATDTARDGHVLRRRWLLVDCDPVRQPGTSSSEAELRLALETRERVQSFLAQRGFAEPVALMSGNGGHLLYRIDLESDAKDTIQRFLRALSTRFSSDRVKVDTTVTNASRITKLAGTMACKGEQTPDRPWRRSRLEGTAASDPSWTPRINSLDLLGTVEEPKSAVAPTAKPAPRSRHLPILQKIEDRCAFMGHCRDDASKLSEPEWYAQLGIIGRCEHGEQLAHERSEPHPEYSASRTTKKLEQASAKAGPRSCRDIEESLGFEGCASCPHHGKITSPISLGKVEVERGKPMAPEDVKLLGLDDPHGFLTAPLNDDGNATRFLAVHKSKVLYCPKLGRWLLWDGRRWMEDELDRVRTLAAEVMELFADQVGQSIQQMPQLRDDLSRHHQFAINSGNLQRLNALLAIAQARVAVSEDVLDTDPWLLTVKNGTIDLRSGELQPHDPSHRITKLAPVNYDPDARSALWERHLDRVMNGNQELVRYLQRWAGCCLTGDISVRAFAVLHGSGSNGKSVTIETLATMLGEYASHTEPRTFEQKFSSNGISNDLARLRGARMVVASETNLGARLDAGLIKRVTGGEKITARYLHHEYFEFLPNFKLIMATNNKPDLPGDDRALWNRVKMIPFEVAIPDVERDPQLGEKLRSPAELSAILCWALEGCLAWQTYGMEEPEAVIEAVQEYRDDQDFFSDWLDSSCMMGDAATRGDLWTSSERLFTNYTKWAELNGAPSLSMRRFAEILRKKGCEPVKRNSSRGWLGIALQDRLSPQTIMFPSGPGLGERNRSAGPTAALAVGGASASTTSANHLAASIAGAATA